MKSPAALGGAFLSEKHRGSAVLDDLPTWSELHKSARVPGCAARPKLFHRYAGTRDVPLGSLTFAGRQGPCAKAHRSYGSPGRDLGSIEQRLDVGPRTNYLACNSQLRRHGAPLFAQHHTQERTIHFEMAIVVDKTKFAELVHEVADARSSCSDHLREYFLTDLCHDWLRPALLAEVC